MIACDPFFVLIHICCSSTSNYNAKIWSILIRHIHYLWSAYVMYQLNGTTISGHHTLLMKLYHLIYYI